MLGIANGICFLKFCQPTLCSRQICFEALRMHACTGGGGGGGGRRLRRRRQHFLAPVVVTKT